MGIGEKRSLFTGNASFDCWSSFSLDFWESLSLLFWSLSSFKKAGLSMLLSTSLGRLKGRIFEVFGCWMTSNAEFVFWTMTGSLLSVKLLASSYFVWTLSPVPKFDCFLAWTATLASFIESLCFDLVPSFLIWSESLGDRDIFYLTFFCFDSLFICWCQF